MRGIQTLGYFVFLKICRKYLFEFFLSLLIICSYATSCTSCTKAKAACKPFNTDKAQAKAKAEMVWRSKARRLKQQTDAEQKAEISRKLEELSKLRGLRKDIWRIAVALEKLASIEGQDSEDEQFSWPTSEEEETEVQEDREKGKQREKKIAKLKGEEENEMEGVKKESSSFSPVAYSVGTRIL